MARESAADKLRRMTLVERELWDAGIIYIAGIDEVGRGPLAGPVVAACVCVPQDKLILGVDDSKKLSATKRDELYAEIIKRAAYVKTAWVSEMEIDDINILHSTRRAMEACAAEFTGDRILIDAMEGLSLPCASRSIIHGDAECFMIAAASIVAKVERDRYMVELDKLYPQYGFARNKGYGTPEHISALRKYGACPAHRRTFISKLLAPQEVRA